MLSSYRRILMVSRAHVLSASRPDFRDIITRQASGVPGIIRVNFFKPGIKKPPKINVDQTINDKRAIEECRAVFT